MQTITKYLVLLVLGLNVQLINAQDTIPKVNNSEEIAKLEAKKEAIKKEERELLKTKVEAINKRLDNGEITAEEAEVLKKEAAKKHALNIQERIVILENKMSFLKRNPNKSSDDDENEFILRIGGLDDGYDKLFYIGKKQKDTIRYRRKYDRRTTSDFVLGFGLNNAIIEGQSLDDSPYKFGGSRFLELGWAWKTRVFKNTNFLRFKYGYSFQFNGLKPNDNQYFVNQDGQTILQEFPEDLRKSKLALTNLVFPMHFEFGPSKRIDKKDYFRYSTKNQFKIGLGGYAGFNIGTRHKLKYTENGQRIKDKQKGGLNTSGLVYGLSSYVAIGDTALYVKYDLSPIFRDQLVEQNNISVGVRFDID